MQSETPAPSEAGQTAHGPGQTLLSSAPIHFNSGTATSRCLGAGAQGPSCVLGWCPALAPLRWVWIGVAAPALQQFPPQPPHAACWELPRLPGHWGSGEPSGLGDAGSSSWQWQCGVVTQALSNAKKAVAGHGSGN